MIVGATPAGPEWSAWALLAVLSAVIVGAVNLISGFYREVDWTTFRSIARRYRGQLLGLGLLDGAAGLGATGLVVLLGVTNPSWIDKPLGWLLLGAVGPAIATVAIAKISVGGTEFNLGFSLLYVPIRDMLLRNVNDAFYHAARLSKAQQEALYRQLADREFDAGRLSLQGAIDELRNYAGRRFTSNSDSTQIATQLRSLEDQRTPPTGSDPRAWEKTQLAVLIAFLVQNRYSAVLKTLVGEPSEEDRNRFGTPSIPTRAAQ